jgi:sec-independent protein translocase protein TatB
MFEVGFTEMVAIAVVALLVLGPERLPKAARFAGLWVRKARAQWFSVKAEFEREIAAEELRRHVPTPDRVVGEIEDAVREALPVPPGPVTPPSVSGDTPRSSDER